MTAHHGRTAASTLSNDVLVSKAAQSNGRAETAEDAAGVLANLPRTRPQRATARRAAARGKDASASASSNGSAATAKPRTAKKPKAAPAKATKATGAAKKARATTQRPRKAAARRAVEEDVPRQGFECQEDRATGSVPPPGGTELIGTAAEIVGELAKAGISGGEKLLRDVLSRLGR
jgi:hypothetical protein